MGRKIGQIITQDTSEIISWVEAETNNNHRLSLHAAPLHVGPLVQEHLFNKKDVVILTSATLRTAGTFDFLRERL